MRFVLAIGTALIALVAAAPAWRRRRRPVSWPRTPSTRAPARQRSTPRATAAPARSSARRGSAAATAAALSFDGTDDYVGLPQLGTFYNTAFTLEAWVQKAGPKNDVGDPRHVDRQRADALGRPRRRRATTSRSAAASRPISIPASTRPWASGSTSPRRSTARPRASTSTALEVVEPRVSGSVGNVRTRGASAPTAARPAASSTASSTRSASTTARSALPRSRPTVISRSASPTRAHRRLLGTSPSPETRRRRCRSSWTASTDDNGVAGYTVYSTARSWTRRRRRRFTVTGLSCSTGYELEVEAFDGCREHLAEALPSSGATTPCDASPGLVAAYAFDEGSGAGRRRRVR